MEEEIIQKAKECGFDLVGFTKAQLQEQDKQNITTWIQKKFYGCMDWYPNRQNIRLNFENIGFVPKSVIALGMLYRTEQGINLKKQLSILVSEYVFGKDYHQVLKQKAKPLLDFLQKKFPAYKFRQGVDSLPIPEKILARDAGLGWIGKNTNLISPEKGSFFFLSVILTDLELSPSLQITDRCGSCKKCLEACPTGALFEEYKIDASKCISHENIENPNEKLNYPLSGWIYGCDICQDVCPWNTKAIRLGRFSNMEEFKPLHFLVQNKENLLNLSQQEWEEWSKQSALKRISYKKWKTNGKFLFK